MGDHTTNVSDKRLYELFLLYSPSPSNLAAVELIYTGLNIHICRGPVSDSQ